MMSQHLRRGCGVGDRCRSVATDEESAARGHLRGEGSVADGAGADRDRVRRDRTGDRRYGLRSGAGRGVLPGSSGPACGPGPRLPSTATTGLRGRQHLPPGAPAGTPALVDVIDPGTNKVVRSIPVSPQPHHIYPVPGSNEAYISHFVGCSMDVVDLVDGRVIGQVGTGAGPRHLAFSPDGHYAYAIDYYGSSLSVIDTTSNATVASIPTGPEPNYPQTSADGRVVFVVNSGTDTVTVAQAIAPFRVLGSITVGKHPFDLALTPDGRTLVVANAGDDTVSFIDTATRTVTATTSIHPPPPAAAPATDPAKQKTNIRVSDDGRFAWVGDQMGSTFSVLDMSSRRLVAVLPAASGADIYTEITHGPARGHAITTARYGPFLDDVSTDPPALLGQIASAPNCPDARQCASVTGDTGPSGVGSHEAVLNPDATRAYVSDRPGAAVSVLDLTSGRPHLLANISTSYGPFGFPDGIAYVSFAGGLAIATD